MRGLRLVTIACLLAATAIAQPIGHPKRILYFTLSAGFKHHSIPTSIEALKQVRIIAHLDFAMKKADSEFQMKYIHCRMDHPIVK